MGLQNKQDDDELLKIAQEAINSTLNQNGGAASGSGYKTEQVSQSIPSLKKTTTQDTGTAGSGYRQTLNNTTSGTTSQKTYSNAEMAKIMADAGGGNESNLLNQLNSSSELSQQAQSTLAKRDKDYAELVQKQTDAENMDIATKAINSLNSANSTNTQTTNASTSNSSKSSSKSSSSKLSNSNSVSGSSKKNNAGVDTYSSSATSKTLTSGSGDFSLNNKLTYLKNKLGSAKTTSEKKKIQEQIDRLNSDTAQKKLSSSKSAIKTKSERNSEEKTAKQNQIKYGTAALLGKDAVDNNSIEAVSSKLKGNSSGDSKVKIPEKELEKAKTTTTKSNNLANSKMETTDSKKSGLNSKLDTKKSDNTLNGLALPTDKTDKKTTTDSRLSTTNTLLGMLKNSKKAEDYTTSNGRGGITYNDDGTVTTRHGDDTRTVQNNRLASAVEGFGQGLTSTARNIVKGFANLVGDTDTANNLTQSEKVSETAKNNHDLSYTAGNVAGNIANSMMMYGAANKVADTYGATDTVAKAVQKAIPSLSDKAAKSVANVTIGQAIDTVLDTEPSIVNDLNNGEDASTILKNVGINQATNLAGNVLGEAVPALWGALRNSKSAKSTATDAVENAIAKTGISYQSPEDAEKEASELLTKALASQNASAELANQNAANEVAKAVTNQNISKGLTYQSPSEATEETNNLLSQYRNGLSRADRLVYNADIDNTEETIPNIVSMANRNTQLSNWKRQFQNADNALSKTESASPNIVNLAKENTNNNGKINLSSYSNSGADEAPSLVDILKGNAQSASADERLTRLANVEKKVEESGDTDFIDFFNEYKKTILNSEISASESMERGLNKELKNRYGTDGVLGDNASAGNAESSLIKEARQGLRFNDVDNADVDFSKSDSTFMADDEASTNVAYGLQKIRGTLSDLSDKQSGNENLSALIEQAKKDYNELENAIYGDTGYGGINAYSGKLMDDFKAINKAEKGSVNGVSVGATLRKLRQNTTGNAVYDSDAAKKFLAEGIAETADETADGAKQSVKEYGDSVVRFNNAKTINSTNNTESGISYARNADDTVRDWNNNAINENTRGVSTSGNNIANARRTGVRGTFSDASQIPSVTSTNVARTTNSVADATANADTAIPSIVNRAKSNAKSATNSFNNEITTARTRYGIPSSVPMDEEALMDIREIQDAYDLTDADAGQAFLEDYYNSLKKTDVNHTPVSNIPIEDEVTVAQPQKTKNKSVASSRDDGSLVLNEKERTYEVDNSDLNDEIEAATNVPKQPKTKSQQAMSEIRQDKTAAFNESMKSMNDSSEKTGNDLWDSMVADSQKVDEGADYTEYPETAEQVNNRLEGYYNEKKQQETANANNTAANATNAENAPKINATTDNGDELGGVRRVSERMAARKDTTDENGYIGRGYTNSIKNSGTATEEQYLKGLEEQTQHYTVSEKESFQTAENAFKSDTEGTVAKYSAKLDGESLRQWSGIDIDGAFITYGHLNELSKQASDAGDAVTAEMYRAKASQVARNYTDAAHYNAQALQAMAKHSGSSQGASMAADGAIQSLRDKTLTDKGVEQLDKASQEIKDLLTTAMENNENLDGKWREVKQILDKYNKLKNKVTDDQIEKLTDGLLKNKDWDGIQSLLAGEITGYRNVTQDALDKASELFEEAQKYNYNSKKYMDLENDAYKVIVNDMITKSTWTGKGFLQKADSARYLMMLCNPRTMVKNNIGNKMFGSLTEVKDTLSGLIEDGVDLASKMFGGDGITRTKTAAMPSKELRTAAREYGLENAARDLSGSKYTNPAVKLDQMEPTFSNKNWYGKLANKLSKMTSDILENDDEKAMMSKYSWSLARYIKANGYDASVFTDSTKKDFLQQAGDYAVEEAKRAAFHQDSKLAKELTSICTSLKSGNAADRVAGIAIDATIPFKKTPINVLKSALEYSPAEMVNVLGDVAKLSKCNSQTAPKQVTKLIDDIGKTATGTALVIGGALAAHEGWIKVSQGDGKREQRTNSQTGNQSMAAYIGGARISLSDLTPSTYALIMGASMEESYGGGDDAMTSFLKGIQSCASALVDTTMLSGISDILTNIKYADDDEDTLGVIGKTVAENYAGQFLPTLGRAINSTINENATSTYSDKTGILGDLETEGKYLETKIPTLSKLGEVASENNVPVLKNLKLEPSIDRWGNETKNNDTGVSLNSKIGGSKLAQTAGRAFANLATPTKITADTSTELDNKIRNLKEEAVSSGMSSDDADKLFPYTTTSESSITGVGKLSPSEWTTYQKNKGTASKEMASALLVDEVLGDNVTTEEKASILQSCYSVAKAYAQKQSGGTLKSNESLVKIYEEQGAEAVVKQLYSTAQKSELSNDIKASVGKESDDSVSINDSLYYLNSLSKAEAQKVVKSGNLTGEGTYSYSNGEWKYTQKNGKTSQTYVSEEEKAQQEKEKAQLGNADSSMYERYKSAKIPGLSTSASTFSSIYNAADADGNGTLKKQEVVNYLNTTDWDTETKSAFYDVVRGNRNWKDVY